MNQREKYICILTFWIFIASRSAFGQSVKNSLTFKTSTGHHIKIFTAKIFYDDKVIFVREYDDDILYEGNSNRIIEDHGTIFLFIAIDGRPNLDRLEAFTITPTKAVLVADAILSPIKDYDNDGYLEFGGSDLTEVYPNPDSMYYIPTAYYEIRQGKIQPDNELTKLQDIKINGLYLSPDRQLDKDGVCCKVIPVPGRKHKNIAPALPSHDIAYGKPFMASDTISVYAINEVLSNKADINYVVHDDNGRWFFYSDEKKYETGTPLKKIDLAAIIKIDKSVLDLSIVPKGYFAERSSKTNPWGWNKLKKLF